MHGLADQVFAQHGAKCGPAVAAARVGRGAGALQLDIETIALRRPVFPQQDDASVAESGQIPKLVTGIGRGDGLGAGKNLIAREEGGGLGVSESGGVESERLGQRAVEENETWLGDRGGVHPGVERFWQASVGVVEAPAGRGEGGGVRGGAHGAERARRRPVRRCGNGGWRTGRRPALFLCLTC